MIEYISSYPRVVGEVEVSISIDFLFKRFVDYVRDNFTTDDSNKVKKLVFSRNINSLHVGGLGKFRSNKERGYTINLIKANEWLVEQGFMRRRLLTNE